MLCFIDTETGGLTTDMSLLSIALVVTNDTLVIQNTFTLDIKPDDGVYRVHPRALEVNRINLAEHAGRAATYTQATAYIREFLHPYRALAMRMTPVGWNLMFDFRFVRAHLPGVPWDDVLSYRGLDVQAVSRFMQLRGKLPLALGSLDSHIRHYGIADAQEHSALSDCMMTIDVLKRFIDAD